MISLVFTSNPAIWAIIGVVVGGLLTGLINYLLQRSQFRHNKEMFYLKNQSREKSKEYLIELLNHKTYPERKFTTLEKRIGAYQGEELRRLLIEVGALRTQSQSGEEFWYLKEREQERKNPKKEGYS